MKRINIPIFISGLVLTVGAMVIPFVLEIDVFQHFNYINVLQKNIVTSTTTQYDIYDGEDKIVTISDYNKLQSYLLDKYQNKIAYGDGKLFFADSVSVVERYSDSEIVDTVAMYEQVAEQAQFEVSAVKIFNVETMEHYYVPNIQVWEQALVNIGRAINSTNNYGTNAQIVPITSYEYSRETVDVEEVLSNKTLTEEIMGKLEDTYSIQPGDTLETIAIANGITVAELLLLNPTIKADALLIAGTQLAVTTSEYHNNFTTIAVIEREVPVLYDIEYIDDDSLYIDEEIIEQDGQDGSQLVQLSVKYTPDGEEILLNRVEIGAITEPVPQIVRRGTKESPHVGTGVFSWPTTSRRTSAEFGVDYLWGASRWHAGLDINQGANAPIYAVDNGVIITNDFSSGYGNYIIVDHNNGYWSLYAHLSSSNVRVGQIVRQGEEIGYMGSTGLSTGVHLHLEIRVGANTSEAAQNPRNYLV
jgi:Membrane proteins related to metalloendopeptidases